MFLISPWESQTNFFCLYFIFPFWHLSFNQIFCMLSSPLTSDLRHGKELWLAVPITISSNPQCNFFFLVLKSVTSTLCLHSNLLAWQENSVCSSKCHILSISLISHRNMTTKSIFSSLLCNHRYSIWSTIFPKNFLQITKSAEKKR